MKIQNVHRILLNPTLYQEMIHTILDAIRSPLKFFFNRNIFTTEYIRRTWYFIKKVITYILDTIFGT